MTSTNTQVQTLAIANITIKQDAEGRYCLNDLHKAAGGANKNKPSMWLGNAQVLELAAEVEKAGIPAITSKQRVGTYVCKELVYAYAMWISPSFHLEVIRAYDRLATQGVAVHKNAADDLLKNPLKYLKVLMAQAEELQATEGRTGSASVRAALSPRLRGGQYKGNKKLFYNNCISCYL